MKNLAAKNLTNVRSVDRVRAIVIDEDRILLMYRKNQGKKYNTFPGGGIDSGESREKAVIRECKEETSVDIEVDKLLYEVDWDHETKEFYYLCRYLKGTPLLGDFNEKEAMKSTSQYYKPYWEQLSNLKDLVLYPLEIRDLLILDIKNGFANDKKNLYLELKTCRQTI